MANGLPLSVPAWINGTQRSQTIHDLSATTKSTDGQAAADDFAEAG
jgi:hypothetical protein